MSATFDYLNRHVLLSFLLAISLAACETKGDKMFTKVLPSRSNVDFRNTLIEDDAFNVMNYPYFYNGGGVAVGDINNDGLPDLFFTGNMVKNRLYLNKGNFNFEDITDKSTVASKQGWCTGVTMVDIDGDGWLDIYVSRSADANPLKRRNLLYVNNHDNTFTESAEAYGIADQGYSTHAAFFDYDKDNDLDLVVINHSKKEYMQDVQGKPGIRKLINVDYGTHLYRNDNGHYTNVTEVSGITSNVLSFGLGVAISDLNNDTWPDIYISNDFNEGDYYFINQKNGTFREMSAEMLSYTSLFSMGNDIADLNNDGYPDIITLDMLPESNEMQKMHNGAENFNKFQLLFNNGFSHQYSRNMLQLNRGDGSFDEVGQFAGISNTDWSWTPLAADFDDDGNKDIYITNGYVQDYTNMDYLKYNVDIMTEKDPQKQAEMIEKNKLPTIRMANYMYRNEGHVNFSNQTAAWGLDDPGISAGAAYADLDNDGDLDIIMNNSNDVAGLYENNLRTLSPTSRYLNIKLTGWGMNPFAIGSKVILTTNSGIQIQELMPSRGFQSSVDYLIHFGIAANDSVKALKVNWPTGQISTLGAPGFNKVINLNIKDAATGTATNSATVMQPLLSFADTLPFKHAENPYNDFAREGLLPQWFSRQGPAMAKGDINGDKLEDIFIGGAQGQSGMLFTQDKSGKFIKHTDVALANDVAFEDITAAIFDADGDGDNDLFVGSGGYELTPGDPLLENRLYFNNGHGVFTKATAALPADFINDNAVSVADFNGDGFPDIFIGGFCVPGKYPEGSGSAFLLNDGKGHFAKQNNSWLKGFEQHDLVTSSIAADINNDGKQDLVITGHFMGIEVWLNKTNHFEKDTTFSGSVGHGLCNTLVAADIDGDGDIDILAGNQGLNDQFKANTAEPLEMYYSNFDNNGTSEAVMAYYIDHKLWPIYSRDDLMHQLPSFNKRFLYYQDYANADMPALFGDQLSNATHFTASNMSSVLLENDGKKFITHPLPIEAQWYPIYSMIVTDVNGDGKKDIITGGNQSYSRIKFGAYSCGRGDVFINKGSFIFERLSPAESGLKVPGDTRNIMLSGHQLIFGVNDQQPLVWRINK